MMFRLLWFKRLAVLLLTAPVLGGCADLLFPSDSTPSDFYVLNAIPPNSAVVEPEGHSKGIVVGVAPVLLPEYLKQPQIVTHVSRNQVDLDEFNRWAAPLEEHTADIIAQNLSAMIPTDRVAVLPVSRAVPLDYRVEVEIARFDRTDDGTVILLAWWRIFDGEETSLITMRESFYRETVDGESYDAMVAAMSRAIATLSQDIADVLDSRRATS